MWSFKGVSLQQVPGAIPRFPSLAGLNQREYVYNSPLKDRSTLNKKDSEECFCQSTSHPGTEDSPTRWTIVDSASTLQESEGPSAPPSISDNNRSDPEKAPPPPSPKQTAVGFWHSSLSSTRWEVLKNYSRTCKCVGISECSC